MDSYWNSLRNKGAAEPDLYEKEDDEELFADPDLTIPDHTT